MIRMSRTSIILTLVVCLIGILCALPNMLTPAQLAHMPKFLQSTINLGLELQGGAHLQLEIDMDAAERDMMRVIVDEVRGSLRKNKIGYTGLKIEEIPHAKNEKDDQSSSARVSVVLRDSSDLDKTISLLKKIDREWRITRDGSSTLWIGLDPEVLSKRQTMIVEQSIEVVRRRIDESGTKEPLIQSQGRDRIILQLPGVSNPDEVRQRLGKTAKLEFRIVDENATVSQDSQGRPMGIPPVGTEFLPEIIRSKAGDEITRYIPVKKQVMVAGDALVDAQVTTTQYGQPAVSLKFNSVGARKFAGMSKTYLQKQFAIVLDNAVISAPVFQDIIPDGNGQISGRFTIAEANELALLLRAGALPAPLKIIEERTVGPSLGADSIKDGERATVISFILVSIFMILGYSLFGVFSNIALVFNLVMLFGALSVLQATLTLPGIAAIALTIGMAVDANVLIYERVKEELRHGLRPVFAIESGYKRAMTTIIDSNVTSLVGAAVLFEFGSGPIRGFAVNLALGIIISMFTAIYLTKLMISWWFGKSNRTTLPV